MAKWKNSPVIFYLHALRELVILVRVGFILMKLTCCPSAEALRRLHISSNVHSLANEFYTPALCRAAALLELCQLDWLSQPERAIDRVEFDGQAELFPMQDEHAATLRN